MDPAPPDSPVGTGDAAAIGAIARAKWFILGAAVVVAVAVFALQSARDKRYESVAIIRVIPAGQDTGLMIQPDALAQITSAYAEFARSPAVERKEAYPSRDDVELRVATDADSTGLIRFTATAASPRAASSAAGSFGARFSNALSRLGDQKRTAALEQVTSRIAFLQDQLDREDDSSPSAVARAAELQALRSKAADVQTQEYDKAQVISAPVTPDSASTPRPKRDAVIAALLLVAFLVVAVYVRALVSPRFRTGAEAAEALGLELLGEVPRTERDSPGSAEAFRLLRARIDFALRPIAAGREREGFVNERGRALTIVIAATDSGTGKTFVSIALARAMAVSGSHTLLVDGDLRKPDVHRRLGLSATPGVVNLLRDVEARPAVQSLEIASVGAEAAATLGVLPSGGAVADSSELLAAANLSAIESTLRESRDLVIIDTPPLSSVADAAIFAAAADAVVFVIDPTRSRRSDATRAVQFLRQAGTPIIGCVVNGVRTKIDDYYGYGYGRREDDQA